MGSEREGDVGWSRHVEGAKKISIHDYVAVSSPLCRYSCLLSSCKKKSRSLKSARCIMSVGRQLFSPTNCYVTFYRTKKQF